MNRLLLFIFFALFLFSCKKEVSTSPDYNEATKSKVYVESVPTDMKIFKNGFYTGLNTPAFLNRLEYSTYQITLKKELYRDTAFTLSITDDSEINLLIDLHKNPKMLGSLLCESIPNNALIQFNDSLTEITTPHKFENLIPGTYNIKYIYPDYRGYNNSFVVRSSFTTRVFMNLTDTSVWVPYNTQEFELLDKNLTSINLGPNSSVLIGTDNYGLVLFEDNNFMSFNKDNSEFNAEDVYDIYTKNNISWIASDNGLFKFDGLNFTNYNSENSNFPSDIISSITSDNFNNIWIGFKSDGIAKFDGSKFDFYNSSNSISTLNGINGIACDNQNNIWIGTSANGVIKYDGNNFEVKNELLSYGKDIQTIAAFENQIWITHRPKIEHEGGISYFNGSNWQNYTTLLPRNYISNFRIDKNNTKYLSTPSGLYIFNNTNNIEFYDKSKTGLNINLINATITNPKNEVWIVTNGNGLFRFKRN